MSRRRFNFPLDLPDNWQDIQYLSASGDAFDPPDEKRGYNYLSRRINELAEAINSLSSPEEDCVYRDQGIENANKVIATTEEGICSAHNIGRSLEIDNETKTLQCKRLVENAESVSGGVRFTFNTGERLGVSTVLSGWEARKSYVLGDIVRSPLLKSYEYLQCTKAGTSGDTFTSEMINQKIGGARVNDGTCQWRKKDWRCKHNTGDIVEKISTKAPESYEYLLELNGQSFNTTTYYELAQLFTSGKLPDTRNRFTEHTSAANGTLIAPGLPNITGTIPNVNKHTDPSTNPATGCFSGTTYPNRAGHGHSDRWQMIVQFNAAKSNALYGASSTVQPAAVVVKRYVCFA